MEPYTPNQTPMRPVPVHDIWSAIGFDRETGNLIDPEREQAKKLEELFPVKRHDRKTLPRIWDSFDKAAPTNGHEGGDA